MRRTCRCPDLVLISGEDLTPYRECSKRVLAVLQRYGPAQRLGMDETWVDITKVCGNSAVCVLCVFLLMQLAIRLPPLAAAQLRSSAAYAQRCSLQVDSSEF